MPEDKMEEHVKRLASQAADTMDANDAMKYSQAALNITNAMLGLHHMKQMPEPRYADRAR